MIKTKIKFLKNFRKIKKKIMIWKMFSNLVNFSMKFVDLVAYFIEIFGQNYWNFKWNFFLG